MKLEIDRAAIGKRIDQAIKKMQNIDDKAYSMAAIARQLDLSREMIRKYSNGTAWPRLDTFILLAECVAEPVEWLMFGVRFDESEIVSLRERACVSKEECQVLEIFRKTNTEGQRLIINIISGLQMLHPISDNVETFPISKSSDYKKSSQ